MRKMLSALFVSATLVPAFAFAQEKNKIEGSGNVVTRDYPVTSFNELSINGVFSVELSQGDKETVRIEAEDNLQSLFQVKNEGSKLVISMKKDVDMKPKKKVVLHLSFKKLKAMDLTTVGDVSASGSLNFDALKLRNSSVGSVNLKLTANSINIDNKSVGDIQLSGKAEKVVIRNSAIGSLSAGSFVVQELDIENQGIGEAEVNAEKNLKVKDSMLGKVINKGPAKAKNMNKVVI